MSKYQALTSLWTTEPLIESARREQYGMGDGHQRGLEKIVSSLPPKQKKKNEKKRKCSTESSTVRSCGDTRATTLETFRSSQ